MEWNWTFHIETQYPKKDWNYWEYHLSGKGWAVKDHFLTDGEVHYGPGFWPHQNKLTLHAKTKSPRNPKTLEIFIGFVHSLEGLKKSQRVKFTIKSDGIFSDWYYYCNDKHMGNSFFEKKSFEVFLLITEEGELEIVSKENKSE